MKSKLLLFPIFIILLTSVVSASSITRVLPKTTLSPGESITVSINVDLTNGESFYIVDEIIPQGFKASNPSNDGSTTDKGHVKWVTFMDAKSTTLTYTLTAPQKPGTYRFSGQYGIDGSDEILNITGQDTIVVSQSAGSFPVLLILFPIIVVIIVVTIALKKKG